MKTSISDKMFQLFLIILFSAFVAVCVYPFYYILIYSLSDAREVVKADMYFLPVGFTLSNYAQVIHLKGITNSFFVSIIRTVVGTAVTLVVNSMLAYALTKRLLPGRKIFYRIAVISMYVNAGLIPWYIVMIKLGMRNNPLAYVLPYAVGVFYMILIKTYIEQLPSAIEESALVDGAGYFTILFRIIIPLSKPILAAVAVFSAVFQWNVWTDNLFLINNKNMQTLQLTLLNYLNQAESIARQAMSGNSMQGVQVNLSPLTIKMTLTMVVALPIIFVYPLMQKYFVKGIMVGAVKG